MINSLHDMNIFHVFREKDVLHMLCNYVFNIHATTFLNYSFGSGRSLSNLIIGTNEVFNLCKFRQISFASMAQILAVIYFLLAFY